MKLTIFRPRESIFLKQDHHRGQIFAIFGAFLKHFDGKFINPLLTTGYTHIRLFYTSKRKNERKKVPRWCCQSAFFSENSLENFASERLSDVVISPFWSWKTGFLEKLKAKNDSFKSLSTVKKHGKTKKSSKKDATDVKALSRMKVQREVVLSNCFILIRFRCSQLLQKNPPLDTGLHKRENPHWKQRPWKSGLHPDECSPLQDVY